LLLRCISSVFFFQCLSSTYITPTHTLSQALKDHGCQGFIPARSAHDLSFSLRHYAGEVTYKTFNFLEKNRDNLSNDVKSVLRLSQDMFVSGLFRATRRNTGSWQVAPSRTASAADTTSSAAAAGKGPTSVCAFFNESLSELMAKLRAGSPHFVRCLKPNQEKKKSTFVEAEVLRQLRYAGVLETIRIRKVCALCVHCVCVSAVLCCAVRVWVCVSECE
jgi:myosin heavy subunit